MKWHFVCESRNKGHIATILEFETKGNFQNDSRFYKWSIYCNTNTKYFVERKMWPNSRLPMILWVGPCPANK